MTEIFSITEKHNKVFSITHTSEKEYKFDVVEVENESELGTFGIDVTEKLSRLYNGTAWREEETICGMIVGDILYDSDNELYIQRLQ